MAATSSVFSASADRFNSQSTLTFRGHQLPLTHCSYLIPCDPLEPDVGRGLEPGVQLVPRFHQSPKDILFRSAMRRKLPLDQACNLNSSGNVATAPNV